MLTMPHDIYAEECCLASCFWSDEAACIITSETDESDYYDVKNKMLFCAIKRCYAYNPNFSTREVINYCNINKMMGELSDQYIINISTLSIDSYDSYVKKLKEKSNARKSIKILQDTLENLCIPNNPFDLVIEDLQNQIMGLSTQDSVDPKKCEQVANNVRDGRSFEQNMEWIRDRRKRGLPLYQGLEFGFHKLCSTIGGFQKGTLTYIGARSHMGKTTFMLNLVASLGPKISIGIMSLEMTVEMLFNKLIGIMAHKSYSEFCRGDITDEEFLFLKDTAQVLRKSNIVFQYMRDSSIISLCNNAKKMLIVNKIEILFIDYLTLIKACGKHQNNHMAINEISKCLQTLAKKMNIPIVCLAQLNRSSAKLGARPTIADFRESGSIEEDADTCILLHRPDYYNKSESQGILEVNIAKNRIMGELKTFQFDKVGRSECLKELDEISVEVKRANDKNKSSLFSDLND